MEGQYDDTRHATKDAPPALFNVTNWLICLEIIIGVIEKILYCLCAIVEIDIG